MNKFIVSCQYQPTKMKVLFRFIDSRTKYKSFIENLNSLIVQKTINSFDDFKLVLMEIKEKFENEFKDVVAYDDLKSNFLIIYNWTIYKDKISSLENEFEFVATSGFIECENGTFI